MKRSDFFLFALALVFGCASAQALEDQRRNAVVELVELMGVDQVLADSRVFCIQQVTQGWYSPAGTARRGEKFYGKTPASPEWAHLLSLYSEYAERVCGHPKPAEAKELYVNFYLNALTPEAVVAYKQFLGSPEGREVIATQPAFIRDLMPQISGQQNALVAGAYEKLTEELNRLDTSKDKDRAILIAFLVVFAVLFFSAGGFVGYRLAKRSKNKAAS
ncbi:MAG TPA: hypothetical protein PLW86_10525 [Rhodocyclaceae bacterium]|nr:hypothetical protein [Rhodocyclaceae bacterium]